MLESDPIFFLCALFLERTLETTLASSRLSSMGRSPENAGGRRACSAASGMGNRAPRPSAFRSSPLREPEQPRTTRIEEKFFLALLKSVTIDVSHPFLTLTSFLTVFLKTFYCKPQTTIFLFPLLWFSSADD